MEKTLRSDFSGKYIIKAILFCLVFTLLLVLFSFSKSLLPSYYERIAHGIIGTAAAFVTTVLFLKFDKKQFSDIGLTFERNTVKKFFVGVITGVLIMGLLAASVVHFSNVEVDVNPNSNLLHFLLVTAPLLPLAFMEELAFRSYPLEILKDKAGLRLSLIITSILFALYHIANGWTIASSFYGPAVWGLVFGLAAIYSRGIAMPTGIHYAANLTTASLGSKNTTGNIWIVRQPDSPSLNDGGTDWLTILPSFALLLFAIICIEVYIRRTKSSGAIDKVIVHEHGQDQVLKKMK